MRQYGFKVDKAREGAINWIREIAKRDGFSKAVIGISGGKDSAIAAALCCRALGKENVYGMMLPNGEQSDLDDSVRVCKALGIRYGEINIKSAYDAVISQYKLGESKDSRGDLEWSLTDEACINIAPRLRMVMLRLWAQSNGYRLCGTSNLSEITVGYCTKDGDTSCDFNPLGKLTSIEVVQIGNTLKELPKDIVNKTPTDGLSGVSDEEKLGVSYYNIHRYIRSIRLEDKEWYKINRLNKMGIHKHNTQAPVYTPDESIIYDSITNLD